MFTEIIRIEGMLIEEETKEGMFTDEKQDRRNVQWGGDKMKECSLMRKKKERMFIEEEIKRRNVPWWKTDKKESSLRRRKTEE
jgi:hypothetical protein